ncbi:hypothetical protein SLS53_004421 [Cytospora paraplurivora]|uniref:HNH nuclease domain-containing protein n=1 Tax=Cytospora paraplurivora TaxID=2898453 RepID=A0AAN9UF15_9PEZI
MSLIKPKRWSPRSIMSVLVPHLFRKPRGAGEQLGAPRTEKVPLDASIQHMHLTQKQRKFKKSILEKYRLNRRPGSVPGRMLWCVLTGAWVPDDWLAIAHIFPPELGSLVEMDTMGTAELWHANNGLMLPRPIGRALRDLALVIVPSQTLVRRVTVRYAARISDTAHEGLEAHNTVQYKIKILEPWHKDLKTPLFPGGAMLGLRGKDLDNRELVFRNKSRPMVSLMYFHCCCAMWKKTWHDNPKVTERDVFWELFLENMKELWGDKVVRQKSITDVFLPKQKDEEVQEEDLPEPEQVSPDESGLDQRVDCSIQGEHPE